MNNEVLYKRILKVNNYLRQNGIELAKIEKYNSIITKIYQSYSDSECISKFNEAYKSKSYWIFDPYCFLTNRSYEYYNTIHKCLISLSNLVSVNNFENKNEKTEFGIKKSLDIMLAYLFCNKSFPEDLIVEYLQKHEAINNIPMDIIVGIINRRIKNKKLINNVLCLMKNDDLDDSYNEVFLKIIQDNACDERMQRYWFLKLIKKHSFFYVLAFNKINTDILNQYLNSKYVTKRMIENLPVFQSPTGAMADNTSYQINFVDIFKYKVKINEKSLILLIQLYGFRKGFFENLEFLLLNESPEKVKKYNSQLYNILVKQINLLFDKKDDFFRQNIRRDHLVFCNLFHFLLYRKSIKKLINFYKNNDYGLQKLDPIFKGFSSKKYLSNFFKNQSLKSKDLEFIFINFEKYLIKNDIIIEILKSKKTSKNMLTRLYYLVKQDKNLKNDKSLILNIVSHRNYRHVSGAILDLINE